MLASVVLTEAKFAAARANAAAALRSDAVSNLASSPIPINTETAPFSAGTTYVWPTLPVKPRDSSVLRDSKTSLGRAPSLVTGMPIAFIPVGVFVTA